MNDSSFIISPINADFSNVWSEPELLSAEGHNALYVATRFGRKYVLKALSEPYRESTPHIELLRKEFTIGVGVDHPNIVRLLDFGHMDSIGWYIQMEYIDGITLDQFLETHPPMAIRRRVIEQLLGALSCLHERQIIHRDIKPSNILITRNGSTVKLIDFGVRGNGIVSRILAIPVTSIIIRSKPKQKPACGTLPYLRESKYHE